MSACGAESAGLTEHTSVSRTRSPEDADQGSHRKRRRKVLSCLDCRRRKVQCDRQSPACGRCVKAGLGAQCSYVEENGVAASDSRLDDIECKRPSDRNGGFAQNFALITSNGGSPDALRGRLHAQNARIQQLETALSRSAPSLPVVRSVTLGAQESQTHAAETTKSDQDVKPPAQPMIFRGKAFKTEYSGPSSGWATIAQVGDFHHFLHGAMEMSPRLQRIRKEMRARGDEEAVAESHPDYVPTVATADDAALRALLPSQEVTDRAVQLYHATYGTIYHIVHLPTFWKAYDGLWSQAAEPPSSAFIAVILLMIATVACLDSDGTGTDHQSKAASRLRAVVMIDTCERWVEAQTHKKGAAETFQLLCLLVLAKTINAEKTKRRPTEVGGLMLRLMSMGFHRSPSHLRKATSEVDKELRRRMWTMIADLELETSFERGIVAVPWLSQSDTEAPRNIRDESIEDDEIPVELSATTYSTSSYLALVTRSFGLRSNLNVRLNTVGGRFAFEEVMKYTQELTAISQAIPLSVDTAPQAVRAALELKHLQYILALHSASLRTATSSIQRNTSIMTILDTATRIVDVHRDLLNAGNRSILLLRQDYIRAGFVLAQVALTTNYLQSSVYTKAVDDTVPGLMERIVELLTDRVFRLGCEHKSLWFVLATQAYIKSCRDSARRSMYQQEAVDAIVSLYDKSQEAKQQMNGAAASLAGSSTKATPWALGDVPFDMNGILPFNFDDMESWTFEDWMADSIDWQTGSSAPASGGAFQGYT
ncbi:hypothetical protein B0A48_10106 [Cryoendolithus antarcticus]|uniref:Zn(2)-C6 fungal-type domain-containing protein n=1 Tax=Cryoendolithus antarcticus TaxID=1507870 RepID=A0A1V8SX19_9PEZI|nr:hypothetical protein B0A48_10106 [Cryoendolithus antarcticus]